MNNTLPNWRAACTPHRDIREDAVSEALFAVNLSRAIADEGPAEYRDPTLFFERTHLTRTLKASCAMCSHPGRRAGRIHRPRASFTSRPTSAAARPTPSWRSITCSPPRRRRWPCPTWRSSCAPTTIKTIPQAAVAALPCADLDAGGREVEGVHVRTLWGELAYRLGGAALYDLVLIATRAAGARRGQAAPPAHRRRPQP